jgi:type II secretory pathway pseudopilin PulG
MAALLVGLTVMAVVMTMAMPVWSTAAKRAREDELVFRGEQYARAIGLYQRKYANALPPSIDVLLNERFLRRKYLDPITGGEFQALTGAAGQATPGVGGAGCNPGRAAQRRAAALPDVDCQPVVPVRPARVGHWAGHRAGARSAPAAALSASRARARRNHSACTTGAAHTTSGPLSPCSARRRPAQARPVRRFPVRGGVAAPEIVVPDPAPDPA